MSRRLGVHLPAKAGLENLRERFSNIGAYQQPYNERLKNGEGSYDSMHVRNEDEMDTARIPKNNQRAIIQDSESHLWFARHLWLFMSEQHR